MDTSAITVQAQYSFKGSNNDELCFKKGDIITLTQREEGGWWEGTLGDKTGWFPSNYVKEYAGPLPLSETIRPPEEIQAFRSVVFRDLLESEKAHVAELRGLVENFLEPLEASQILSANEYTQLMCNFLEVVEMHEEFLQTLEDCNDRVGKVFLSKAPSMKKIHQTYCAAHPRAIVIVDKFREDLNVFMEKQGAAKPGLLVLTTGLSKPFRRLDKYAAILQELERHMESGHPDRGDTQRSIAVYKDIASSCSATRRQKELELQILTGPVRGWQGAELSTLGDIIHMGSVAVGPEHKDRYLVLFPQTLLILSVSQRMSAFKYEGKLPLTGITVNRLEDTDQIKHAFEISGSLIDRIIAVCQGPTEANRWVELLSPKSGAGSEQPSAGSVVDLKRNVSSSAVNIPQPPPHVALDSRGYSTRVSICAYGASGQWCSKYGSEFEVTYPPASYPPTAPYAQLTVYLRRLFRAGELSRYVVQALLYPQVTQSYDRHQVVMRRKRHKTTVRMQRREQQATAAATCADERNGNTRDAGHSLSNAEAVDADSCESVSSGSSCVSSTCSRDRSHLERQNAVDYVEEDDEAYETITFFAGKRKDSEEADSTVYESYTDPHATDGGSFKFAGCNSRDNRATIDSVDSESATDQEGEDDYEHDGHRSSEMIGSTAVPYLRINDRESLAIGDGSWCAGKAGAHYASSIHTSTARLLMGDLKQQVSEQSQMSSFEHRTAHGGRMACEDLLNLDDSMQMTHSLQQKTIAEERHSMPTYFVGNRFNNSSVTEIYIPSWKAEDRANAGSGDGGEGASGDDRNSVHSSSLDIPAIVPAPDPVTAELLYNFSKTLPSPSWKSGTPPSGGAGGLNLALGGCLSREQSPFRKNDSHEQASGESGPSWLGVASVADVGSKSTATRRCISYQYVQLSCSRTVAAQPTSTDQHQVDSNNNPPGTYDTGNRKDDQCPSGSGAGTGDASFSSPEHKCRFCSYYSRGHSPHSSDSGMAGSCTISTPDGPAKFSGDFLLCDYAAQHARQNVDGVETLMADDGDRSNAHAICEDGDVVDGAPVMQTRVNSRDKERERISPVSSSLRHARSSHNLGRFSLVRDSEFDFTDSGQYDHHNDPHHNDSSQSIGRQQVANKDTVREGEKASKSMKCIGYVSGAATANEHSPFFDAESTGRDRSSRSRSEDRLLSSFSSQDRNDAGNVELKQYFGRSRIVVNLYDRSSSRTAAQTGQATDGASADMVTFKTGLYAHWWKKEKLPIFVVTSHESLKLPPASGRLPRPTSPRSAASPLPHPPQVPPNSNVKSASSSREYAVTSADDDGLLWRPLNSSNHRGAARGSDVTTVDDRKQPSVAQRIVQPRAANVSTQTQPVVQPSPQLQSGAATASAPTTATKATSTESKSVTFPELPEPKSSRGKASGSKSKRFFGKS
uniref:DH domain-containing protein n=1 Tax=Anopheles atroparvus TaxID=41427 RepID=A0AAG5CW15_ANOAO